MSMRSCHTCLLSVSHQLGDGRGAKSAERRRAQNPARRDPEKKKKEGHLVLLLPLHGSDLCRVRPAHRGARRQWHRNSAVGGRRKLDGGAGHLISWCTLSTVDFDHCWTEKYSVPRSVPHRWKLRCGWRRWPSTSVRTSTSGFPPTTASCCTRRKATCVRSTTSTRCSRRWTASATGEVPSADRPWRWNGPLQNFCLKKK